MGAVWKLDIALEYLHFAFAGAPSFNDEFRTDRKPARQTAQLGSHGNVLSGCRHPGTPTCRSSGTLRPMAFYPRYPQVPAGVVAFRATSRSEPRRVRKTTPIGGLGHGSAGLCDHDCAAQEH